MKTALATLEWGLWIICPYCDHAMDLSDQDIDHNYIFSSAIFNRQWGGLKNYELECKHCHKEYKIEGVKY